MTGKWVKKRDWRVSHFLLDDRQRPRHLGLEVGRAACGHFIAISEYLEDEPTGVDTCGRCVRCRRRLVAVGAVQDTEE